MLTGIGSAQAVTLSLPPRDDSYISEETPSEIFGLSTELLLRNNSRWDFQTLISFDLSTIPKNSTIERAYLHLYFYRLQDHDASRWLFNAYRVTSSWNEETATWTLRPDALPVPSASTHCPLNNNAWVSWDVTNDVDDFFTGAHPNYGWIVTKADSTDGAMIFFYSKEARTNQPYLEVTFAPPLDPESSDTATPGQAAVVIDIPGLSLAVTLLAVTTVILALAMVFIFVLGRKKP